MPQIRKKTSKRGTTNKRRRISQKVRESRKKKTKADKKNVQWKSKLKKDPGIPNTFPYKDQILAEVAEQRRLAVEEKQRRKDEKRNTAASTDESISKEVEGGDVGFDGIASISAKRLTAKATAKPASDTEEVDELDEEEDAPMLINQDLPHLEAVLDQADVVVEVLDARDPLSFRSSELEEMIASKPGRRTVLILNKIDLCPQEAVTAWASALRKQHPTFLFRSATSLLPGNPLIPVSVKGKGKAKDPADDAVGADTILECFGKWAQEKKGESAFTVAVVGVTNSGKSCFVNSLLKKSVLPIYSLTSSSRGPTTTVLPQEVMINVTEKPIRFIDTPGLTWVSDKAASDADETRARDILLRNKGRIDRLKDPLPAVAYLVSKANTEDLMLLYSLPAFLAADVDGFLAGVARSQQLIRKRGALDLTGASKTVLRDWCTGKIHWYTTPPADLTPATSPADARLESFYEKDKGVLSLLETRKAMRRAGGLVKLVSGRVDSRGLVSKEQYAGLAADSDTDEDGEDGTKSSEEDGEDEEGEEEEEEEAEAEEEEEEAQQEQAPVLLSGKQKRKRAAQASLPPSKKAALNAKGPRSKSARTDGTDAKRSDFEAQALPPRKLAVAKPVIKSSKLHPKKATAGAGHEEAYDFGKFF